MAMAFCRLVAIRDSDDPSGRGYWDGVFATSISNFSVANYYREMNLDFTGQLLATQSSVF